MRKIYSLVLLAAALLVGTTAWANYSSSWLQDQFDAVPADGQTHTITMQDNIDLTDPVYLGTASVDDPRKSIILDMNGHHITMDATTWVTTKGNVYCSMFTITHGELLIRNNNKSVTSLIQMTGKGYDYIGSDSKRYLAQYNNIFNVAGSYKSSRWVKSGNTYEIDENAAINTRDKGWFTHLEIGEGVKVVAENTIYGAGISIDGYYTNYHAMISPNAVPASGNPTGVFGTSGLTGATKGNVCLYNRSDAPAYNTAILSKASEGVAYGVRVDVYGDIEFATAATEGKAYGIKLNGGLRSSLRENEIFQNQYCWKMDEAYARTYGATEAPTTNATKSFVIGETAYNNHYNDTVDAPFLYIHSTAHIIAAAELNEATAVYCSGYGKTLIEGACSGNSGINIKAGTVELHDAEITGTATSYENAEQGNHATGSGGIVVNSVDNRAGGIEVVISGDTKVSTTVGYAIEEVVNKTNGEGTDVSSIDIQGGTIEGGNLGAIALTTEGGDATAITGGNVSGTATVGDNEVEISDLVPQNQDYHTTTVTDGNKTIIVVSEGSAPTGQETVMGGVASVNWKHNDASTTPMTETIKATVAGNDTVVTLTELEINQSYAQTLTIKSGSELNVGRVVLGTNAQIIVEPGAKFLVTGAQGMVAPVTSNLVLKATATSQATFVIAPEVTSNKQPKGSVEYYTEAYGIPSTGTSTDYKWDRLSSPLSTYGSITNNYATLDPKPALLPGETKLTTWVEQYNETAQQWEGIYYNQMRPFVNYAWSNNAASGGITYTFSGNLQGNVANNIELDHAGWNYMGNAFLAPIHVRTMLQAIESGNNGIDPAMYLWNMESQSYQPVSTTMYTYFSDGPKEIPAMQTFIIKLTGSSAILDLGYKESVYDYVINPNAYSAPQRTISTDVNAFRMNITSVNGEEDNVYMVESSEFSADHENGADIVKYMNDGINFYVEGEDKYSMLASDNILGTMFSLQTTEAINYTLSFAEVRGEEYALRDNMNSTVMNIVEGATYNFYAQPNETIEGRFEIVSRQEMPTAVETIEETVAPKAIYTIMGQYVGQDWNTLPAGVYVVDGVKVVK